MRIFINNSDKITKPKECDLTWTQYVKMNIEKIELNLVSILFGKEDCICFSNWHYSYSKTWSLLSWRIVLFNFDKCGWPKRSCKSLEDGKVKQDIDGLVPR